MRGILQDKLFNKHYLKLIHSQSSSSKKPSVNTVSSVTLLASAKNHSQEDIIEARRYFLNLGLICEVYIIFDKKDEASLLPEYHIIDREQCKWYGIPSQEILIQWLANKTDLLIVSNPDQQLLIKYLCAASNSKLKSSIAYKKEYMNDMDIDLWIDIGDRSEASLTEQCKLTYRMIANLGIRPPVIG